MVSDRPVTSGRPVERPRSVGPDVSFDCDLMPALAVPDEPHRVDGNRLNGVVVQEAELGQMIFDIPTLIEYCSSFNPLSCGDVIVTGTPGGVGVKRTPPLWMKPGDIVEVEIDGIGTLRNGIADEEPDS